MFKQLQKIGKSFMLPIALLPAAGLLLGIGGSLSNVNTIATYPFLNVPFLQNIFKIMSSAGSVVFENLALLLCIGLSIGLAKKDKATAALASVVGYITMTRTISTMVIILNPNGTAIDTGVVGAIVIGSLTAYLHNRYNNIQLPAILGFFGGSRFVPIVTAFVGIFIGIIFSIIWPPFQQLLISSGNSISKMGPIGTFLYGFLMRLSGAVGLHHMIYPMFWFTELGGVEVVAGKSIIGAQKIFFAQLADINHVGLFTEGTRYFAGRFATMIFGLPASCLAMYHCVKKEKKAKFSGLFLGAALTSFITGITEPIEFMFLFVSPLLYVFHAFLDGVSFLIADILNINIGNTFSGGVIDFTLFGILQGNAKTNWVLVIPVGIIWIALYYFSFKFFIKKFNILTPGRENESTKVSLVTTKDSSLNDEAIQVLRALGGQENIEDIDACITRLRVNVKSIDKVNKDELKRIGAFGVLEVKGGIQAIYGARAILYKSAIEELMGVSD